jgi:hypothetical protein
MLSQTELTRYDCEKGFVIFADGEPYQIMYRTRWNFRLLIGGLDNGAYWLLPVNGLPIPIDFQRFLDERFSDAVIHERARAMENAVRPSILANKPLPSPAEAWPVPTALRVDDWY